MLKGTHRSVIVMRTDKSSRFESAYFVLRPGGQTGERGARSARGADATAEARAILLAGERKRRRPRVRGALLAAAFYILGAASGAAAVLLLGLNF